MKTEEQKIWERYQNLLNEDIQSSKKTAIRFLTNSGVDNAEQVVNDFEMFMNQQKQRVAQEKQRYIVDEHIVAMCFLLVGSGNLSNAGITNVKEEYASYLDTDAYASSNELSKSFLDARTTIQNKKLFKPEHQEEKLSIIKNFFNTFTSGLHAAYSLQQQSEMEKSGVTETGLPIDSIDPSDIVYKDENIIVILADTRRKTIKYGHPNLCISWADQRNYFWRYRMGKQRSDGQGMTTYFVYDINKIGKNGFIVDALGDENGPSTGNTYGYTPVPENGDHTKTESEIIRMHPYVKPAFEKGVFKFIPYTDTEKRYMYIDENINNILESEKFESNEDYYMFIESGKKVKPEEWEKLPRPLIKPLIIKYASVAENFNLTPELKKKYLTPSDRRVLDEKQLKRIKECFARL